MCDCAGNSKPKNLNVPVNKNVDGLKNTKDKDKDKNKNKKNITIPTEKTSKTTNFLSNLFAKFI